MLASSKQTIFVPLLSALLRGGEPFWNPTVNKVSLATTTLYFELELIMFMFLP